MNGVRAFIRLVLTCLMSGALVFIISDKRNVAYAQQTGTLFDYDLIMSALELNAQGDPVSLLVKLDRFTLTLVPFYGSGQNLIWVSPVAWSPDGNYLVIERPRLVTDERMVFCVLTRTGTLVSCSDEYIQRGKGIDTLQEDLVTWSADSRKFYFLADSATSSSNLVEVDAQTGVTLRIVHQVFLSDENPVYGSLGWGKDLNFLVLGAGRPPEDSVILLNKSSGFPIEINIGKVLLNKGLDLEYTCTRMTPKKGDIALQAKRNGQNRFVVLSKTTAIIKELPDEFGGMKFRGISCPVWQADDNAFYFVGRLETDVYSRIYRVDMKTNQATVSSAPDDRDVDILLKSYYGEMQLSPDGKSFALVTWKGREFAVRVFYPGGFITVVQPYRQVTSPLWIPNPDTPAIYRPATSTFHFPTLPAVTFGNPNDHPITGDWDGDGIDTLGVFDPLQGRFQLRNSNTPGAPDLSFLYGNPGDIPLAGHWTATATHDGVGTYRNTNGTMYLFLMNQLSTGYADLTAIVGNPGDLPIVGDWNGDGVDTVGLYRPDSTTFYLFNRNAPDMQPEVIFTLSGGVPLAGRWTGSGGAAGVGFFADGVFSLKDTLESGAFDRTVNFGETGDLPLAGRWSP
jgi:hypothetical protein